MFHNQSTKKRAKSVTHANRGKFLERVIDMAIQNIVTLD
ncbi:hypothetical protein LSPCS325_16250 [Lysinibacillus sp. CTST325]